MTKFVVSTIAFSILIGNLSYRTTVGFEYPTEEKGCPIGSCVNVRNCSSLLKVLEGPKPLSHESAELLKNSQCGFDGDSPKVCCDNGDITERSPIFVTTIGDNKAIATTTTSSEITGPPDVTSHPNLRLLEHNICGPVTSGRIFGGNKTGIFDFPWMALVAYRIDNNKYEFRCGGTVINKRYVLTAAHCVSGLPSNLVLSGVRLGDHDLSKERDCDQDEDDLEYVCSEKYQDFLVESAHTHPEYSRAYFHNDIAIIRLDRDADFRPISVKPICLPFGSATEIAQRKVTVTGWGATETGPRSPDLLMVVISLVPNDECAMIYRNNTVIWHKQLCAGGHNRMDSCNGDSGGPLQSAGTYNDVNVRFIQHGVVSFGWKECGVERRPGVYTRVSYYLDWILDTMRD